MEIGVQTMTTYEEALTLARWAETEGLACFTVADHYLTGGGEEPALDQLTLLGGIARDTRSILLGTLVSPVTFRHPAVMLKAAVTLDRMSDGRFSLGVGAGWMEEEHRAFGLPFPDAHQRFAMLEEALGYIRAALDPAAPGFDGAHYRLEPGFHPRPRPRHLRVVVGGTGSTRTPDLAARFADEYNLFPSERRDEAERVEAFRRSAAAAGRDPDAILVSATFPPLAAETKEELAVRVEKVAAARRTPSSRLLEAYAARGIPHGTPDQVGEGLDRLSRIGVGRLYLQVYRMALEDVAEAVDVFRSVAA